KIARVDQILQRPRRLLLVCRVLIDDFAQFSQIVSQDGLSRMQNRAAINRNSNRSQNRDDRDDDHQLEKAEAAMPARPTSPYISCHRVRSHPTWYRHQKRFGLPMIATWDRPDRTASPIRWSSSSDRWVSCEGTSASYPRRPQRPSWGLRQQEL